MIRLLTFIHPLFHRRGVMTACWVCRAAWKRLERDTDLMAAIERGIADMEAGRVHKWADVRRKY